jgi:hypothetical protein
VTLGPGKPKHGVARASLDLQGISAI